MVEYTGGLVLVAMVLTVLMTSGLAGQVAHSIACSVTSAFGAATSGCSAATAVPAGAATGGGGPSGAPGSPSPTGSPGSPNPTGGPGSANPTPSPGSPSPAPNPGSPNPNPAAAAGQPPPNPQPGDAPQWRWPSSAGNHADQLPTGGDRPYSPPKSGRGNPVRVRGGGFVDEDGNVWEWAPSGAQHGGPHWDVQHPDRSHTNVAPDGTVIGDDNFPNKRRVPKPPPPPPPESSGDGNTAKIVGGAAAAAGAAGLAWWLGKAASPLCGPAIIVCGLVF